MNSLETQYTSLFENRFWLQIMGDHARFIEYSLPVTEMESIQTAHHFIDVFDQLLELVMGQIEESEMDNFNRIAYKNTYDFQQFKLKLLALTLEGKLRAHLSSTFFNHMLNELGEYLLILSRLIDHQETLNHQFTITCFGYWMRLDMHRVFPQISMRWKQILLRKATAMKSSLRIYI